MRLVLRGIGIHHDSLDRKTRRITEVLSKQGKLGLVIATSTLAQGIHMPCKTVVILGKEKQMESTLFRQMCGRSGRRGFDMRGEVVLFDISAGAIERLITSKLPSFTGHDVVTASHVLRINARFRDVATRSSSQSHGFMLSQTQELKNTVECFRRLALNSFKCEYSPLELAQNAIFYRYSYDLLVRENLVAPDGFVEGLAGLVGHFFDLEPLNFLFGRLLRVETFYSFVLKNPSGKEQW
jgi:replicative superfamily II helicase